MIKRFEAVVSGRVQGIGYRFFVQHHAARIGLKGYAKNLPDDTVEIIAEGEEEKLKKFLALLERGPPFAHIESIHVEWTEPKKEFPSFEVR
jgi:acylphosphatase